MMDSRASVSLDSLLREIPELAPPDEHNRKLAGNVHPPDWKNPEPKSRYNLVVVGGGTAGLVTAMGAAGLGARVALIERKLMGGDCLNSGCVPSKALIRSARAVAAVRDAGQFGISVAEGPTVDFSAVMERMRRLRARISKHDSATRLAEAGVDVFFGTASFVGADALRVNDATLRFARACIATGSSPAVPPIEGLAEAGYLTNETIFSLTELPRRLAIVGGGPIGCELAQTFARFGSEVHLIEMLDRLLPNDDPDAAGIVQRSLHRDGARIELEAKLTSVRREGKTTVLAIEAKDGEKRQLQVDAILVAVGRAANVQGLGLEEAGVQYSRQGIQVDDYLATSNRNIYAAGDVCFKYKFTHTADALARIVIRNSLFFGREKASALTVPWCTYTDPEVAHVGISAHEAQDRGIPTSTLMVPMAEVDRAILDGEEEGFVKIRARKGTDRILGATIVARHAGEMISEVTVAMRSGVGLSTLASTIHPYPTQAEAIKKAGDTYNRTRLTPLVKRAFETLLRWRR